MSTFEHIQVEPLTPTIGATVSGVDLSQLDDATFDEIHAAWMEHLVLFFRDQKLAGRTPCLRKAPRSSAYPPSGPLRARQPRADGDSHRQRFISQQRLGMALRCVRRRRTAHG